MNSEHVEVLRTMRDGWAAGQIGENEEAALDAAIAALSAPQPPAEAEIEALREDKSDLEAALEYLKAHKENAVMNRDGIIKALSEVRDEQGAEIHKLRAELEIAKNQAEFYRTTRNWNQQKADRLAEALKDLEVCANTADYCYSKRPENFAVALRELRDSAERSRDALRDHDQENGNGFWPEMQKSGGPDWTGFDG